MTDFLYNQVPEGETRPVVTLIHSVDFSGSTIRVYDYQATAFLQLMDAIYPELVNGTLTRVGKFYAIFDDHGFVGSMTGRPKPGSPGKFGAGAIRKNPLYAGDDRHVMMRAMLALKAFGGSDEYPGVTKRDNYAILKLWRTLGIGCKPVYNGKKWSPCAATPEAIMTRDNAIAMVRGMYGSIRAAQVKRLASYGDISHVMPDEQVLIAEGRSPVFTADVTL